MDLTFGPETKFVGIPADMKQNRSPFDGLQFYGIGRIDGDAQVLTRCTMSKANGSTRSISNRRRDPSPISD
jgi:hypothetical protein